MESKWTDEIRERLSKLYAADQKTKPGHAPKGINTQKTAKILPQLNVQDEGEQTWGSDTPIE